MSFIPKLVFQLPAVVELQAPVLPRLRPLELLPNLAHTDLALSRHLSHYGVSAVRIMHDDQHDDYLRITTKSPVFGELGRGRFLPQADAVDIATLFQKKVSRLPRTTEDFAHLLIDMAYETKAERFVPLDATTVNPVIYPADRVVQAALNVRTAINETSAWETDVALKVAGVIVGITKDSTKVSVMAAIEHKLGTKL